MAPAPPRPKVAPASATASARRMVRWVIVGCSMVAPVAVAAGRLIASSGPWCDVPPAVAAADAALGVTTSAHPGRYDRPVPGSPSPWAPASFLALLDPA